MGSNRCLSLTVSALLLASCALGGSGPSDGSPPLVRIDAPADQATVSGQVSIDITAVDDFGVEKVRVLIDGVLRAELFSPPFHLDWNSRLVPNNTVHTIGVVASDAAKNVSSVQISVTVMNSVQAPPVVAP